MTFDERLAQLMQEFPDLRFSGEMECSFCGQYEVLYLDRVKNVFVRTCRTCDYIQVIDLDSCPSLAR
ncbi:MAG: hypothetical protein BWY80_00270 [Firmicutes bacterium ADurb.Bin456]|nr:MAG: hypothetical protein BWY80_00270 [Firmicutes bacterium ADurb.Bin456]